MKRREFITLLGGAVGCQMRRQRPQPHFPRTVDHRKMKQELTESDRTKRQTVAGSGVLADMFPEQGRSLVVMPA
jgi:hypothetical protein